MNRYPTQPIAVYAQRREQLAKQVAKRGGGVVLLTAGLEVMRNRDSDYPFRSDSYFYYLTGFPEPEATLVMQVSAQGDSESVLFCREKNEEREIWDGFRYGPEQAKLQFGFAQTFSSSELTHQLEQLLSNQVAVFFRVGADATLQSQIETALQGVKAKARRGVLAPRAMMDVTVELDELRLFKQPEELDTMRKAGHISALAHRRAMLTAQPGCYEYEIEAELLHTFRHHGSEFPAYGSIVAGGANACVLHYRANTARLQPGDLLLIDAGCELDCYASDITRTFPVDGVFTKPQQAVYEVVLAAQNAAIEVTKPGARFNAPHQAALRVLVQGLLDLKLLAGTVDDAIETKTYQQFYMHRTGHWLGMDVHDCGSYRELDAPLGAPEHEDHSRLLQPGMVMTIEPGLYIRPAPNVPEQYHHIGIRIEDDAIVTTQGCEIYTHEVPKTVAEIQALMKQGKGASR